MNGKVCVMVTGVGGGGHGEQILKALRLSSINYKIVGSDQSPLSKGLFEVDYPHILPAARDPNYIASLLFICKKYQVKALFHGSEPELKKMDEYRKDIMEAGIFLPINPSNVITTCMDKSKTMAFLAKHGFYYPKTITVTNETSLNEVDFFPAVLKPSIGGGGSANIMLAQTPEELLVFGRYLLSIYSEFIVQEYVGTPDVEFTVGVLLTMEGKIINSIAVKRQITSSLSNRIKIKNHTNNKLLGDMLVISSGVSQGEIGRFPEVTKPCEKIALALGCCGAVNIQCRAVAGKIYVFEINPRFSGTTSLRAMVGYNEPDILIRKYVLGEIIPSHFDYKSGYIMRGLAETFIENKFIPTAAATI